MKRFSLLVVLPLVACCTVSAQKAPPPRVVLLALDTDGDGRLSAAEIEAAPKSLLKLDRNGDGELSAEEYTPKPDDAAAVSDLEQRLMLLDRNGDGVLTADEMPGRMKGMFERGDADHDGKLTKDEIAAMAAKQTGPQGRPVGRGNFSSMDPVMLALDVDKDGVLSAAEITSAPGALKTLDKDADGILSAAELRMQQQTPRQRAQHLFDEWDTNKDGALRKEEMPDRMQPQFDSIDTNHDGKVDLDEATTYFANMPQDGRPGGAAAPGLGPHPGASRQ